MRLLHVIALGLATMSATAALGAEDNWFTADSIKGHVAFLADDLLEGRETGTRGHELAARYVATQFEALGLQPAGDKGGWYQTVKFRERKLGAGEARVTITGPGGAKSWANATDVLVGPSAIEAVQDIEAPVVFVGYGIDAPAQGANDYAGLDVRGKIVAAFGGFPKGMNSELGAHLAEQKAKMAERRGAIGFVSLRTLGDDKRVPWKRVLEHGNHPRMSWVGPDGQPHVEAPKVRLGASLNTPAADALFAGAKRSFAAVRQEAETKAPKGFPLKTRLRVQRTSEYREVTSPNVLAMLPGSDPTLKNEVVLLMGHLDHLGIDPDRKGDKIFNGAIDNATGIAALIETARAFAQSPERPKRSILFMATTAEEKGLLGADYFAHHPSLPLDRVAAVVNIDMPVLTYDFGGIIAFGSESSTLGPVVKRAAGRIGVALEADPLPEEGIFTRSDHYPLVTKGVPAVFLFTGFKDAKGGMTGEKAFEHFLSTDYHQPSDQLDLPIDYAAGAKFARINWLIAREIANGEARPRWYKGDFFGDTFASGAPKAPKPAAAAKAD